MALEAPFLAAVIARMDDPVYNLAAFGVAFAFAILVESPVIMLMSASTALVEDAESYRKLRSFANSLNIGSTALLVLVLIPPVYNGLVYGLLQLPESVGSLVYISLWLLLPWPAAIGYRRFLHGVLIRSGRTRLVAYGTLVRLLGMGVPAILLYKYVDIPGAWVGATALSAGVMVEALATRVMAAGTVRQVLANGTAATVKAVPIAPEIAAEGGVGAEKAALGEAYTAGGVIEEPQQSSSWAASAGYRGIARFYYPLALTSLLGLTVHPILTFFMGRAPMPIESLAVFPVVNGLAFLFRAPGFSYQEVVIALHGKGFENIGKLIRFGIVMAAVASGTLAVVVFTPLASIWFGTISGLSPELSSLAVNPARILVPLPALAVLLAYQQATLVQGHRTRAITYATALEVLGIALLFPVFGYHLGMFGASAAMLALLGGRLAGNAAMLWPVTQTIRAVRYR